jgi:hypothetical protein
VYEVTGRKKCVCFLGKFEEFWPVTVVERGKEDRAFTMPQELRVPKMTLFGVPVNERCVNSVSCGRWTVVSDKS